MWLEIYSFIIISILIISALAEDTKEGKIGALILAPILAYFISALFIN